MKSKWIPLLCVALAGALSACNLGSASGAGGSAGGGQAAVADYTWRDMNKNGIQDKGEGPLADVEVGLYRDGETTPAATMRSDKDGKYRFENVEAGMYRLKFDPPAGFIFTEKDSEDDDTVDSDPYPSGNDQGWTDPFEVSEGEDVTRDAGFFELAATATPTPEIVIPQPTAVTVTPTNTAEPVDPSGSHEVDLVVSYDKAGHKIYVKLADRSAFEVTQADGEITMLVESEDDGFTTCLTFTGPIDENGNVDLVGTGYAAGFQNVSATFVGSITADADGTVHINGELTIGGNEELPQGEPIVYQVSS